LGQFKFYFDKHGIGEHLEIYNSGSFLDDKQISPVSRDAIFEELENKKIESITIESRPEYIKPEILDPLIAHYSGELKIAIGLEVARDSALKKLRKGFTLREIEKAILIIRKMGFSSRAYILVGAPFDENPRVSTLRSVEYAKKTGFSEISLLGAYPMKGSPGYQLWKRAEWTPLTIQDFDKIISEVKKIEKDIDYSSSGLRSFWGVPNEKR
jgi:radical SAM enzyme (TIGR01210 family)